MDLSIIIVNYKSQAKLKTCLESIKQADWSGITGEVLVVENSSGEDLGPLITEESWRLIESEKNLGMGGGNNLGLQQAQGEYVFILNPDTFLNPGAIKVLLNYLRANPQVGLVGPRLLNPDQSLQYSCARFPKFFIPLLRRTPLGKYFPRLQKSFLMQDFDHQSARPVDWLMGSALMFKKEIKLETGEIWSPQFDERFFMYFEDIDLSRQFWQQGLKVVYQPAAGLDSWPRLRER